MSAPFSDLLAKIDRVGQFYDRHGNPIGFHEMARRKWLTQPREDVVAYSEYCNFEVSTVWLGWAEGEDAEGRPRIFETLISDVDSEDHSFVWARYATEAEAAFGHAVLLGYLRIHQPQPALPPGP